MSLRLCAAGWTPLLLIALLVLAAPAAQAAPADDYQAVAADFRGDGDISDCRFTRQQLINAGTVAAGVPDFDTYAPGFRAEVAREVRRHDSGACRGIAGGPAGRANSPLRSVRITAIRPRQGLRESVTIRNNGSSSVNLGRATLRDRRGNRVRIPRGTRLGARRSLRVITGCLRGGKRAVRRGSRLYACRRSRVWDDTGDVVKVVDTRGRVVAQRGYGRLRRVLSF
jgi:hypothetical protein